MFLKENDLIRKEYMRYKKLIAEGKGPFSFEVKEKPKIGDIRIFGLFPPIYFLIVEKSQLPFDLEKTLYKENNTKCRGGFYIRSLYFGQAKARPYIFQKTLYKVIPLSEEIALSHLNQHTPFFIFEKHNLCLCALPFWLYLTEELLFEYSKKIATTDKESIKKCIQYAEDTPIPENYQGKFIKKEMERLSEYNTFSLIDFVEAAELEVQRSFLNSEVAEEIKSEYSYLMAASSKKVFKGKNWYGVVEKGPSGNPQLVLYLPCSVIGKNVIIRLKEKVIFEGVLSTDKLVIENFPSLADYSFLEEELHVQIREL